MAMGQRLALLALALAAWAQCVAGRITDARIRQDDRQIIQMAEPFGFSEGGRINISLAHFAARGVAPVGKDGKPGAKGPTPDASRMGFYITPIELILQLEVNLNEGKCPLDTPDVAATLFRLNEVDTSTGTLKYGFALNDLLEGYTGGMFDLYFCNCEPNSVVDMDARIALFNQKGARVDYLPVGEDALAGIYFLAFLAFCGLGVVWALFVLRARAHSQSIHYLMGLLVVLKSLTVLSQSGMYHMIALHGSPEGWNIAYYIFTFLRGILFFVVVILIATGWSYMKPFLNDREKTILAVVVPLQVFANVAIVVLDEYTPAKESWFTWRDLLHLVDIVCCCVILFPIVWSIKHLREAAESDGKAARALTKLSLFRTFYIMVVAYIYFTRIIVYLLQSTLPYRSTWLANLASELATLTFYVACGLQFRPLPGGVNPYFALDTEEVELANPDRS